MKGNSMSAEANVGVVGLAAMGGSLARNLAHHGNKVAVFNRTYARTEKLMNEHGTEGEFYPGEDPRGVRGQPRPSRAPPSSWSRPANPLTP